MVNQPYKVYNYSIDKLKSIFNEVIVDSSMESINVKFHVKFFEDYFSGIGCKKIIAELDYTDHDFVDDYSHYYVKCFRPYKKTCVRLHFFNTGFTKKGFDNFIKNDEASKVNEAFLDTSYLGFIILKPLPKTFIGKTCLKTYPTKNTSRYFPITRNYTVNLFGAKLHVNSLAFQEQDSVIAACATSALWSVFQGTGILFHHSIPTPHEITKIATKDMPISKRVLPSKGLTYFEMAKAISSIGLEPEFFEFTDQDLFKLTLYSYLKCKIPILLGGQYYNKSSNEKLDLHAISITGFNLKQNTSKYSDIHQISTSAFNIDKIYVHNDNIGPFSRLVFDDTLVEDKFALKTTYPNLYFIPQIAIVPLYNKIRLSSGCIINFTKAFNEFLKILSTEKDINIIWDIFLSENSEFKNEILNNNSIKPEIKYAALTGNLPKYIWRVKAAISGNVLFELIFDSTDIDQGNFFIKAIYYDNNICHFIQKSIKNIFNDEKLYAIISKRISIEYFRYFKNF